MFPTASFAETIELVTYYPANVSAGEAEFDRLHADRATIGDTPYSLQVPVGLTSGTLLVADALGIGPAFTASAPQGALHVVGTDDGLDRVLFLPGADTAAAGTPDIRVGIGTAVPQALLDLQHPQDAAFVRVQGVGDADNFSGLELRSDEAADKVWQIAHKRAPGLNDLHVNYFDGAGWSTKMAFQPGGNVGVGTATPSNDLTVLQKSDGQATGGVATYRANGSSRGVFFQGGDNNTYLFNYGGGMRFYVNGAVEAMAVTPSGNVGIGMANPGAKLEVLDGITITQPGNGLARLGLNSSNDPAGGTPWNIYSIGGSHAGDARKGNLEIQDNSAYPVFALCIQKGTGYVAIGHTVPSYPLHVNGAVCASNIACPSDIRLKKDVAPLDGILPKLGRLHGVSFRWNDLAKSAAVGVSGGRQMGLIAQEVEGIFPELVVPGGKYKAVDYAKFSVVLVEAVKELKAQNEAQQRRVGALASENQELKRRIEKLEGAAYR